MLMVDIGGKIQGELGISKQYQNKISVKKNGKDKIYSKNGNTNNS